MTFLQFKAPDVGVVFEYQEHRFRVNGWLKPMPPPVYSDSFGGMIESILYQTQQECGPNREKLVFCSREDAVYVSGVGVCGVIVSISDAKIVGRVDWSEEKINLERQYANQLIGTPII